MLSTSTRAAHGASVVSTQMDTLESVAQLRAAQALGDALGNAATHQTALLSEDANKAQKEFINTLNPKQKGKYTAPVNTQPALKADAGSRALAATQPVEKFDSAVVLLESPASINLASKASTVLFAAQHLHWSTQSDTHWAAAQTVASVSGNATSLFTHEGGMQAFAGNGPVSLQAHTGQLELLADKDITILSVNDQIVIKANQKIRLMAGQSSVTLEGGNITLACPGNFTVKGAQHTFAGASSLAAELKQLPSGCIAIDPPSVSLFTRYDEQIVYKDSHGEAMADIPVHVKNKNQSTQTFIRKTPAKGEIDRIDTVTSQALEYALRYSTFNFKA